MTKAERFQKHPHEEYSKVYVTTDYSLFENIGGNRKSVSGQLKKLAKAFLDKQLEIPALVNEKGQIIDGKHRFATAKKTKKPFFYMICNGFGTREMREINMRTPAKAWNADDCLDFYMNEEKKPEYRVFYDFKEKYKAFKIASLLTILMPGCKRAVAKFKEGNFSPTNLKASHELVKKMLEFKEYFPAYYNQRDFITACILLFKQSEYNHEIMLERCEQAKSKIKTSEFESVFPVEKNLRGVMYAFEQFYNSGRGRKAGGGTTFAKTEFEFQQREKEKLASKNMPLVKVKEMQVRKILEQSSKKVNV